MSELNEKHWWTNIDKNGRIQYHDVDIIANARVQGIMIRAQVNKTELGYWRDVATGLAELVDELDLKAQDHELIMKRLRAAQEKNEDVKVYLVGPPNLLACRECLHETSAPHAFIARINGLCLRHFLRKPKEEESA